MQPPVNASVTLCFEINGGEEASHHGLIAKVFRIDEKGVVLVFNDYDNDTVNALRDVVRQAHLARRHWRWALGCPRSWKVSR